jgi:hypothetical protein
MPQTFEGFDLNRAQDKNKSAKDAFADLSKAAPTAPTQDKAALGQWFGQYIRPGMDALGHKVSGVDGDKFTYGNHEGNFSVDYGRGAGAAGGALAWQAEPADDATRARYGTPAASGGGNAAPPVSHTMPVPSVGQSSLVTQILAALQEQTTPDPQDLLMQALR